jgi:hypothetical protein
MTAFEINASCIKDLTDLENTVRPNSDLPDNFWLDVEATIQNLTELKNEVASLFPPTHPKSFWTKRDQNETG